MKYFPKIGLEVHVQLKTKSKMFCGCDNNAEGKSPNTVVCPVCLGFPGVLPVANKQAIEWTLKVGKALNCKIAGETKFDRKHYFYPDLPKNFQDSQYDEPFAHQGELKFKIQNSKFKIIRIRRAHLEEDAGKLLHPEGKNYSLVDLNRSGTPLLEIVSEPDIESPEEAGEFLRNLRLLLRHLDVSDADMEKGQLRCDANVSITPISNFQFPISKQFSNFKSQISKLGTPVEIKNLNSFKMVEKALFYEIKRQTKVLESGGKIEKETRGWNDRTGETISQRSKEFAHDYRYFPEPDLPLFVELDALKISLPKSLDDERETASEIIGSQNAKVIFASMILAQKYRGAMAVDGSADHQKTIAVLLVNRALSRQLPAGDLYELAKAVDGGGVKQSQVERILKKIIEAKTPALEAIAEIGPQAVGDETLLREIIKKVLEKHQKAVVDYKAGKAQALGFLVGQVMQATRGQADPGKINQLLKEQLDARKRKNKTDAA